MNPTDPIIRKSVQRAQNIWKRRVQILKSQQQPGIIEFKKKVELSVEVRDANESMLKEQALNRLHENGFSVLTARDGLSVVTAVQNMLKGKKWLRSSSRLGNCIESYFQGVDIVQTDIYDRHVIESQHELKDYFPRHQTYQSDYNRLSFWNGKGMQSNFFFNYLKSVRGGHGAMIGTNQLTASGELVITENAGNINYLLASLKIILLLTSDEKLTANLEMAFLWQNIYKQYGLRKNLMGAHTHILTAPPFTDTLPSATTPFGSNEITIAWIEGKKITYEGKSCIECNLCMEVCPAVELYGTSFSWRGYSGALGILKSSLWEGADGVWKSNAWMCNDCGKCSHICPAGFDVFGNLKKIKERLRFDQAFIESENMSASLIAEYISCTKDDRVDYPM